MNLIPLPVAIPFLVAAFLAAAGKYVKKAVTGWIAVLTTLGLFAICIRLIGLSWPKPLVYWFGGWAPRAGVSVGIDFYVDPVAAGLAAFTCFLVLCSFIFSLFYFKSVKGLFHALMLIFMGAMCGFCFSGDLFNLFVWLELMSAAAIALCGHKSEEPKSLQGAINFAVTNTVGAFLSLTGVGLIYGRTGGLNMAQVGQALALHAPDQLVVIAFVFIISGFLVKAAVVPFHFWLADAHAVAPTPVCVLFSGIMVELGLYAVARVFWTVFSPVLSGRALVFQDVFLWMGCLTAVTGAIMCALQRHIKRMLAYSTISHVGLMVIGFALMSSRAWGGTLLYIAGHGAVKGALFIGAGMILFKFKSVDEYKLRGAGRDTLWLGALMALCGFALAGIPPFSHFYGEDAIKEAAKGLAPEGVLEAVFLFAAMMTAGTVLRVTARIFLGWGAPNEEGSKSTQGDENAETTKDAVEIPPFMYLPAALLVAGAAVVAFIPGFKEGVFHAADVFQQSSAVHGLVLGGKWAGANAPAGVLSETDFWSPLAAVLASLVVAYFGLYLKTPRRGKNPIDALKNFLRSLHSGRVGDYLAWFTLGIAVWGGLLRGLIRL